VRRRDSRVVDTAPAGRGVFIGKRFEHNLLVGGHGDIVLGGDHVGTGEGGADVRLVQVAADGPVPLDGIPRMTVTNMRTYLEHVADRRLTHLGFAPIYRSANPFAFLELQDAQELSNFFELRVSAYQIAISGTVNFDTDF
jgi:hypothetical protein